jgi:hypothetical protein
MHLVGFYYKKAVYTALLSEAGEQTLSLCRKLQPSFKEEMRGFYT